jgi:hypothetical protein
MRGLHAAGLRFDAGQEIRRHGLVGADAAALSRRIVQARELLQRHFDEIRIAQVNRPVAIGAAHGLDDQMLARGGIDRVQVETRQDIEGVQQGTPPDEGGDADTMRAPWYSPTSGLRSMTR